MGSEARALCSARSKWIVRLHNLTIHLKSGLPFVRVFYKSYPKRLTTKERNRMSNRVNILTQQVAEWLSSFGSALAKGDMITATAMFDQECYWRDLVSFTWNLKTLESQAEIEAMLQAQLSQVQPSNWQVDG